MYYYLITTTNMIREIETDRRFGLDDYYKLIDCDCIQYVMSGDGRFNMILDDEGKLKDKDLNYLATLLYNNPLDYIVGEFLLCTDKVINDIGERDFYGFDKPMIQDIKTSITDVLTSLK